jgi:hypothetical protein
MHLRLCLGVRRAQQSDCFAGILSPRKQALMATWRTTSSFTVFSQALREGMALRDRFCMAWFRRAVPHG